MESKLTPAQLKDIHKKDYWRFLFAYDSIERAMTTAKLYEELMKDQKVKLRHTFVSSAIITYSLPFTTSKTLGTLPRRLSQFEDSHLRFVHSTIMDSRNISYAHIDTKVKHYSVQMELHLKDDDMMRYVHVRNRGEIDARLLTDMIPLCEFQLKRLKAELDVVMKLVLPVEDAFRVLMASGSNLSVVNVKWPA